jgi:hypothetical protein
MNAMDMAILNFTAPFNVTVDLHRNDTFAAPTQGYSFYTATIQDAGYQLTLDLYGVAGDGRLYSEDFRPTTFLDNTPYVAPTSVTNTSKSPSSSWRLIDRLYEARTSLFAVAAGSLLLRALV